MFVSGIMGEVIYINNVEDTNDAHIQGEVLCTSCGKEWIGVVPVGTKELECPECHTMKGVFKHHLAPVTKAVWTCNCGNRLFFLLKDKVQCCECGIFTEYGEIDEA